MPNLVGIGNSQVPTNAMLGGLAYQDSVGEIDIDKIKAKIGNNAVDIFVYDTRKDSDGGAWRHRTQNTSWYNEGAGATRGARKEFPAVAVIVVTGGGANEPAITIYDGDDPNLPMWMVFRNRYTGGGDDQTTSVKYYAAGPYPVASVVMLNGVMVDCQYRSPSHIANIIKGVTRYNFINDSSTMMTDEGDFRRNGNLGDERNSVRSYTRISGKEIVNTQCHDVAMTVLPNAPIDASTGLPVPTIAVGTDGGVSIIKDDGNVSDITNTNSGYNYVTQVKIDEKLVYIGFGASGSYIGGIGYAVPIPSTDLSLGAITGSTTAADFRWSNNSTSGSGGQSDYYVNPSNSNGDDVNGTVLTKRGMSFGTESGLSILLNEERDTNGSIAHITKDYNTGYMHRDAKGAFLSSTDTTSIAGGNKVSNGIDWNGAQSSQSSTPPTGWTGGNGATFKIETGNGAVGNYIRLYNENNGGAGPNSYMYQAITTVVGKRYKFTAKQIHHATITVYMKIGTSAGGNELGSSQFVSSSSSTPKQVFGEFTATGTTTYVSLGIVSGTHNYGVGWDDIYVSEMDKDRTVNSNSLHAVGTISKAKVATGADLAYYGGFSNSNYFFQPYNSLLDFGTGDLYIMFWMKNTQNDAYDDLIHRRAHDGSNYTGTGWYLQMGNDQNITLKDSATGASRGQIDADSVYDVWKHICFVRRDGVGYAYKNGDPQSTNGQYAWTENLDNSSAILTIGRSTISGGGDADKTFLALVRLGASSPSEEQIKKIYNDEKCLFHKNAKCTLHGTSDDVEALAYDDTNDTLHVGTSSGRSEFQGLNRINNTTTAVTTAISASNELVAEQ